MTLCPSSYISYMVAVTGFTVPLQLLLSELHCCVFPREEGRDRGGELEGLRDDRWGDLTVLRGSPHNQLGNNLLTEI